MVIKYSNLILIGFLELKLDKEKELKFMSMATSMKGGSSITDEMDMAESFLNLSDHHMRVNGYKAWGVDKERELRKIIHTKENLVKTKNMVKESLSLKMELNMKVTGWMVRNTVKDINHQCLVNLSNRIGYMISW